MVKETRCLTRRVFQLLTEGGEEERRRHQANIIRLIPPFLIASRQSTVVRQLADAHHVELERIGVGFSRMGQWLLNAEIKYR